jgi:splicing factor 3A subunit 1
MVSLPLSGDVGIIVPPPGVRVILDKTARAVASRPALEARIREKHGADPKFAFIRPGDPYHAFFRAQVDAATATGVAQGVADAGAAGTVASATNSAVTADATRAANGDGLSRGEASSGGGGGGGGDAVAAPGVSLSSGGSLVTSALHGRSSHVDVPTHSSALVSSEGAAGSRATTVAVAPAVSKLNVARIHADRTRPVPKDPPPHDVFSVVDVVPSPSHLTLDVIKLAAQFVARHGSEFVQKLTEREFRNPLFDFLKPMHPHAIVFQHLTEAYTAVLYPHLPRSELVKTLEEKAATRDTLLNEAWYLHDWKVLQIAKGADAGRAAAVVENSSAVNPIDWHDFVVLETIDLDETDRNLPAPIADPTQIPRVMAAADAARQAWEKNRRDVDMDMDMEMDEDNGAGNTAHAGPTMSAAAGQVITADIDADIPQNLIRKAVAPLDATETPNNLARGPEFVKEHSRAPNTHALAPAGGIGRLAEREPLNLAPGYGPGAVPAPAELAFSGNTIVGDVPVRLPDGQVVPMSEATPAMRAQLLDPKYKDERSRAAQKHQRQNLADGDQIALHLSLLNRDKPDSGVYNRGDLQTKLAAARRPPSKSTVSSTNEIPMATTSGPERPLASHAVLNKIEPKSDDLQPAKRARIEAAVDALAAAAGKNVSAGTHTAAAVTGSVMARGVVESNDDSLAQLAVQETPEGLLPESEWLAKVGDKVNITVKVPVHPNKDWLLSGQDINMEVPLRSTAIKLKEAIAKVIKIPANKQKLQCGAAGFMKDRMSLAFYNVAQSSIISLEVKERGGRSKR